MLGHQLRLVYRQLAATDFSQRDRDVLNALRPFLGQVKSSLDDVDELRAIIRYHERAAATTGRIVVVLGRGGRVTDASIPAGKLLRWLGGRSGAELPEPLLSWALEHQTGGPYVKPLVVAGPDGLLAARLLHVRGETSQARRYEEVEMGWRLVAGAAKGLLEALHMKRAQIDGVDPQHQSAKARVAPGGCAQHPSAVPSLLRLTSCTRMLTRLREAKLGEFV